MFSGKLMVSTKTVTLLQLSTVCFQFSRKNKFRTLAMLPSCTTKVKPETLIEYACFYLQEEINSLRNKEREERRNGADKAFAQAIVFLSLIK